MKIYRPVIQRLLKCIAWISRPIIRRYAHGLSCATRLITYLILIGLGLVSTGCLSEEPLPTPTPTRTPIIPTATPTPTPTATPLPTPTPTLPPDLILRPPALKPDDWPSLPTDLYFRREGRIWHWAAGGGSVERIPMVEETAQDQVLSYRLAASGQSIIYMTSSEKFYVLDRALRRHAYIPTAGQLLNEEHATFEVTPDGHYLIYIAWGVHPGTEEQAPIVENASSDTPLFGTVLVIDINALLKPQTVMGLCEISPSTSSSACKALHLSSDGSRVVFTDRHGLWMGNLSIGGAQLLAAYPEDDTVTWRPLSWAVDGQQLLIEIARPGETSLAVARLTEATGEGTPNFPEGEIPMAAHFIPLPETVCSERAMCQMEAAWGSAGHWGPDGSWQPAGIWVNKVTQANAGEDQPLDATLFLVQISEEGEPHIVRRTSSADTGGAPNSSLYATSIHPLNDGRLTFIHPDARCPQPCPDCEESARANTLCPSTLMAGIYFMDIDNALRPVALLPHPGGTMHWSPDDQAFLYMDPASNPMWIGQFSPSVLWDVTALLDKAGDFQWVTPRSSPVGASGE